MEAEKTIEAIIAASLSGEQQQTAAAFAAYLRSCGAEFIRDTGYWKDKIYFLVRAAGDYVCYIAIRDPDEPENLWTVWSDDTPSYETAAPSEEIAQTAWRYVDRCGHCGSCAGGRPKTVFGRRFDGVCGCTFRIDNAGADTLPFLREMADLRIADLREAAQ